MRKRQAHVLKEISHRPVIFTQRGRGVAVLVSLDQWEQLMEQLEDLEDAVTALEARLSDADAPSIPLDEVLAELSLESELVV